MASPQGSAYYVSRQRTLLRDFDRMAGRVREVFVSPHGEEQTDALIGETRREYKALIPQLPYIGGKQPYTQFIISAAWTLAMYRVLRARGETFDHGVDYLECATCKFLQQQGAPELGPYLCMSDLLYSEMLDWGLIRTQTLAEGAEKCDFRFKKGGPTRVAVPASLRIVQENRG